MAEQTCPKQIVPRQSKVDQKHVFRRGREELMQRAVTLSALASLCGGVSIFAADRPISASEWLTAVVDIAQSFLPLPAAAPEDDAPAAAAEADADRPPAEPCPSVVAAARRGSSFMALAADVACAVGALTQQFPDMVALDADAVRVADFESQHPKCVTQQGLSQRPGTQLRCVP